ncbi:ATP-grasp domain-containing protein [Ningiella sp. W23]|uniref:ATP-grasp domain-containing protein n=1 Tax=Ningiella sp. W23 TaxID=3023715 RepID=UPI003757C0C9
MPRCAFLSTDNLEDFFVYDDLVKPFLRRLGWAVEDVSWKNKYVDYNQYELVVVRSTWDYQQSPDAFLACLERIHFSKASLENSLALMRWNLSKAYLKDLAQENVQILDTLWYSSYRSQDIQAAFRHFQAQQLIIKPLVSANADDTFLFTLPELSVLDEALQHLFKNRPFMVQAFEASILKDGEYSLFYFSGQFSHAIRKMPASGDFRVQEEHGGQLESLSPSKAMFELAEKTLQAMPADALYARIDMLNTKMGMAIIEVELIEPSLYFNMDIESAKRFAQAIHQKYA